MIKVSPSFVNEMYIQWDSVAGSSFTVFRSNAEQNGFEVLADQVSVPFFVDKTVNLYDDAIHYYYKVEGYDNGAKVDETEVVTMQYHKADAIANKVIYESRVALRVMNNPPVFALIHKREGTPCPQCWNPVTKKIRFAGCTTCNGTGILTGYYPPIPIRISIDISGMEDTHSMLDGSEVTLSPINAWILNTPLLVPGDVLVDIMNQRYRVNQAIKRTKSQYVIRQLLQLIPLKKGHPAYNVDVDRSVTVNE
jgi:hypothetical protein